MPAASRHPATLGPYDVIDVLGQGGMGAVYRARHRELGIVRAVKVMLSRGDARKTARFLREAQNLARIRHPNVVGIHDVGEGEGGRAFFAMDLVAGTPLDEVLANRRLGIDEAIRIAIGLADGVGALHETGVMHRDLKPANVLMAEDGRPVVLDLGLAVDPESDERLTRTGALVGTLLYMSPEQLQGKQATPASDVFSLGLILYELLTGHRAAQGASPVLAVSLVVADRPRPSDSDPEIPVSLDRIFLRTIARDPAQRPENALRLGQLLRQVAEHPGPSRRARRRTALVTGGILLAVALVGVSLAASSRSAEVTKTPPEATPTNPASEVTPAPRALTADEVRRGSQAWREISKLPPEELYERSAAWLRSYPGHELTGDVQAQRAQARFLFPLHVLPPARYALVAGDRVVTLDRQAIRLWTVDPLRETATWPIDYEPQTMAVSQNGELLVVIDSGGLVHPYSLPDGTAKQTIRLALSLRWLTLTPDGRALIGAGAIEAGQPGRARAFVQDLSTGDLLHEFSDHRNQITDISTDGRWLLTASGANLETQGENTIKIWSLETEELIGEKLHFNKPTSVRLSRDRRSIVLGDGNGRLASFDVASGETRFEMRGEASGYWKEGGMDSRRAHRTGVRQLEILGDGRVLSIAGYARDPGSNEFRLWNAKGELLHEVGELPRQPFQMSLPASARWMVLRSSMTHVEIWALPAKGQPGHIR